MADKKPIYNPPTSGDSTGATSKKADATAAEKTTATRRRLGLWPIVGISAAGVALLLGAGVAGASISAAVADGDRDHGRFQQMPGQPGEGHHDGDRDGHGAGHKPGGPMGDGQMPDGQKMDGQMPNGQMPTIPAPTATPAN